MQDCQSNEQGLIVETEKRFRRGGQGKDGTFELRFRPGVVIELVSEDKGDAGSITLTDLALDNLDDPLYLLGRGADGVKVQIEKDRVKRSQWRDLEKTLVAASAVDTDEER